MGWGGHRYVGWLKRKKYKSTGSSSICFLHLWRAGKPTSSKTQLVRIICACIHLWKARMLLTQAFDDCWLNRWHNEESFWIPEVTDLIMLWCCIDESMKNPLLTKELLNYFFVPCLILWLYPRLTLFMQVCR